MKKHFCDCSSELAKLKKELETLKQSIERAPTVYHCANKPPNVYGWYSSYEPNIDTHEAKLIDVKSIGQSRS